MIKRILDNTVRRLFTLFPAVGLSGPRQAGKTTLAQSLGQHYFDLEQEQDRSRLSLQWEQITQKNDLIILDEAQAWPEIFTRLRGEIDRRREQNGRFLILGSVSGILLNQISESLAGRIAMVEMTPFLLGELPEVDVETIWFYGGYPQGGVLNPESYPVWQKNYLEMLIGRDLPNWGLPARPQTTLRLARMLAATHSEELNATKLGQSLDLSYKTVQSYLEYLEGAFLVRRLPPFRANLRKRLIKRPKYYWRDSGLLHALLNINHLEDLYNQPWVGASWEGFVIEQIINAAGRTGRMADNFYLRTSDNYEIDLILDNGRQRTAFEIKMSPWPRREDMEKFDYAAGLIEADRRIVVCRTAQVQTAGKLTIAGLNWTINHMEEWV